MYQKCFQKDAFICTSGTSYARSNFLFFLLRNLACGQKHCGVQNYLAILAPKTLTVF